MNTFHKFWRTIPTRNGIFLFLSLTAFFLIMRLLGLAEIYWLRSLNVIFVILFVRNTLLTYHKKAGASFYDDFGDMFRLGVRTCVIGIGLFAIFMAIYLDQLDQQFMRDLAATENFGGMISPVMAAGVIFVEGMVSAMVVAFVALQLFKSKTVEKPSDDSMKLREEANKHHTA